MENTAFDSNYESKHYQKYYCVIIQYSTKINAEKLAKVGREIQQKNSEVKLGKKYFHFRLVNEEMSY